MSSSHYPGDRGDFPAKGPDYEIFSKILRSIQTGKYKPESVEKFLRKLPKSLKSYYTFVYDSGSFQKATFLKPRVIVFSLDGRVIYTFNGVGLEGDQQIEAMLFDDDNQKFTLHEIQFPGKKFRDLAVVDNPVECRGCHGHKVSRPLWDSYFIWPGIYGSEDDSVTYSEYRDKMRDTPEHVKYEEFQRQKEPRYKILLKNKARSLKDIRPNLILSRLFKDLNFETIKKDIRTYFRKEDFIPLARILSNLLFIRPFDGDAVEDKFRLSVSSADIETVFSQSYYDFKPIFLKFLEEQQILTKAYCESKKTRFFNVFKVHQYFGRARDDRQGDCDLFEKTELGKSASWAVLRLYGERVGLDIRSWAMDKYPRSLVIEDGDGTPVPELIVNFLHEEAGRNE